MRNADTYAEYARECRRLADAAKDQDKAALLRIAEAWDEQAQIAGRASTQKSDGQSQPNLVDKFPHQINGTSLTPPTSVMSTSRPRISAQLIERAYFTDPSCSWALVSLCAVSMRGGEPVRPKRRI